jgi:uncharacterized protein
MEFRSKELYADLHVNEGKPLVVIIGGSRAGIWSIAPSFLDYLKRHYSVLLLAYFGVDGLPKKLKQVPLEYFIRGIEKVRALLKLKDQEVAIIGNSKGGEAALLISEYVNPRAVIACVPSCYVWQGIPKDVFDMMFPRSSWTCQGKPLPFIRMRYDRKILRDIRNKVFRSCYQKSMDANIDPKVRIDLSRYRGKLLLLSSDVDTYWPSKEMCEILVRDFHIDVTHKVLHLTGHYFQEYEESIRETIQFLESAMGS